MVLRVREFLLPAAAAAAGCLLLVWWFAGTTGGDMTRREPGQDAVPDTLDQARAGDSNR